jgi:hypothetical protein
MLIFYQILANRSAKNIWLESYSIILKLKEKSTLNE